MKKAKVKVQPRVPSNSRRTYNLNLLAKDYKVLQSSAGKAKESMNVFIITAALKRAKAA